MLRGMLASLKSVMVSVLWRAKILVMMLTSDIGTMTAME